MKDRWFLTEQKMPPAEYFEGMPSFCEMERLRREGTPWSRPEMDLLVVVKNHPPGARLHMELWKRGTTSVVYFRQVVKAWKRVDMPEGFFTQFK